MGGSLVLRQRSPPRLVAQQLPHAVAGAVVTIALVATAAWRGMPDRAAPTVTELGKDDVLTRTSGYRVADLGDGVRVLQVADVRVCPLKRADARVRFEAQGRVEWATQLDLSWYYNSSMFRRQPWTV